MQTIRRLKRRTRLLTITLVAVTALAGTALPGQAAPVEPSGKPTVVATSQGFAPASVEGLRILITNDDGVQIGPEAEGLFELRKAMCEAGADVAVVAPWFDQSGRSASITFGSPDIDFTLTEPTLAPQYADDCADSPSGGPVFGGCITSADSPPPCGPTSTTLTPADAVTLGASAAVQVLFDWSGGPDLIISGINSGSNDGLNVNVSGTVGGAVIGHSLGYPAIALSASSSGAPPLPLATYHAMAGWAVNFVGLLAANDLLPDDGYVLSVNHPRIDRAPVTEAVWAEVAQFSPFATTYEVDGLNFHSQFGFCDPALVLRCGSPEPGSDSAQLSEGKITISPISVDRTAGKRVPLERVRALVLAGAFNLEPTPSPLGPPFDPPGPPPA